MDHNNGIYFDYNATTPVDPEVFQAMEPYFKQFFGNASSANHHWGWAAGSAVSKAREQLGQLLDCRPQELYFTAGATESNNWAILGLISKLRGQNATAPIHILSSCVEHKSVLETLHFAQKQNVEVDFLPVNRFGQVELETVRQAIKPHTKLMSFIWVNNEIGSINPIAQIGRLAHERQIYFHTDATQAVGKLDIRLSEIAVDMLSLSAHKMYGPKGVGALFIRSRQPKVQIDPFIYGGGQEHGLRAGTLNTPGIVGLGMAAEICNREAGTERARLQALHQQLWRELQDAFPGVQLNGHPTERSYANLNITLPEHKVEQLLPRLQQLAVSAGAACGSGSMSLSHVLLGLGLNEDQIQRSLRLSLGRWTTESEITRAVEILKKAQSAAPGSSEPGRI